MLKINDYVGWSDLILLFNFSLAYFAPKLEINDNFIKLEKIFFVISKSGTTFASNSFNSAR